MKKLILFISVAFLLSFSFIDNENLARVEKINGLYIFIHSTPAKNFQVIGNVKRAGIVWSDKKDETIKRLTKKALEKYQDAKGIIFEGAELESAKVITFE